MRWHVSVLVVASTIGCSGNESKSRSSPAEFIATFVNAQCDLFRRCGMFGTSQLGQCRAEFGATAAQDYYYLEAGSAANRLAIDQAAVMACFDLLRGMSCVEFFSGGRDLEPCDKMIVSLVPPGAACQVNQECIGGRCERHGTPNDCSGSCKAFVATGGDCQTERCNPPDYCDDMHICHAPRSSGEACGGNDVCQRGLQCLRPSMAVAGTCEPLALGAAGTKCSGRGGVNECAVGLYCEPFTNVCAAPVAAGGRCYPALCQDNLACTGGSASATCQPQLDVGSRCDPAAPLSGCPSLAPCDRNTEVCTAKVYSQVGDDCSMQSCKSGEFRNRFYCDASRKCAERIVLGQPCTPDQMLDPCAGGTCDPSTGRCLPACR